MPPSHAGGRCTKLENSKFAALMQQYQKLVYTVCYQFVHDPHTAEDLTQDTFLSAYNSIDQCDPAYHKQWLVRVAANKCKDHLKSGWMRKVQAPGDDALPEPRGAPNPDTQSPEETLVNASEATALAGLIRALREPYGSVATLYLLEEKPVAEIAQRLGRPEKTVQNQLFRAKGILRQQITERRQAP
ncbi:MAG: sigma-70 family RNA polymerase sigma factor [Gemmiger sp.]|nr:sigma-70 family RNA polymerase sigma factor [Gemmiger sp.]